MKDKLERLKELKKHSQSKTERLLRTKCWSDAPHHTAIRVGSEAEVLLRKRLDND